MPMKEAAKQGDIFVSVTGDKGVITLNHMKHMKDGAIVANSGHFDVEIEMAELEKHAKSKREVREHVTEYTMRVNGKRSTANGKRVYVIGEGRLVNLTAAEGHPADVMDMSFANQALAAEWFYKNKGTLRPIVYRLPENIDKKVARLKLNAMGVKFDKLTKEQKKYLSSWEEGT